MPEIALTGLPLDSPHSGTAVYAQNITRFLPQAAPDLDFRLVLRDTDYRPAKGRFQRVQTPFRGFNRDKPMWARLDKLTWETWSFPLAARNADLFHFLYFAAPIFAPAPVIVTVHDLIPLVLPDYHRGHASAIYARLMQWTVRRADAIITVSEHSERDIIRVLGISPDRVYVTPEAADERFVPQVQAGETDRLQERYAISGRYFLYIGGAEKRKNIDTLVRAWSRIADRMRTDNITLLIVAQFPPPDPLYPDIPRLVRELRLTDSIRFIAAVDEEDKPALYRHALTLCFPSTYEGFGLTPIEAMASGTPVIASNATSIPEVMGNAGRLLDPLDVQVWSEAIRAVATSESQRTAMREAGLRRAAQFSWQRTAEQTADVYRQILR